MATTHSNDGAIRLAPEYADRHALLTGFPAPPAWMADAVCATTDPEAFFPEKGGSTREAKKVCSRCLVQAECLDWALDHDERFGVWGGLSEHQRRSLKPPPPARLAAPPSDRAVSTATCTGHSDGGTRAASTPTTRAWARSNGIAVNPRGTVPQALIDQYLTEQQQPAIHEESA